MYSYFQFMIIYFYHYTPNNKNNPGYFMFFAESGGIEPHAVTRTSRLAGGLTRRRESLSL